MNDNGATYKAAGSKEADERSPVGRFTLLFSFVVTLVQHSDASGTAVAQVPLPAVLLHCVDVAGITTCTTALGLSRLAAAALASLTTDHMLTNNSCAYSMGADNNT